MLVYLLPQQVKHFFFQGIFGAILSRAQGSLLALLSGITHGRARGPIWGAGDPTCVVQAKGKRPIGCVLLTLSSHCFRIFLASLNQGGVGFPPSTTPGRSFIHHWAEPNPSLAGRTLTYCWEEPNP